MCDPYTCWNKTLHILRKHGCWGTVNPRDSIKSVRPTSIWDCGSMFLSLGEESKCTLNLCDIFRGNQLQLTLAFLEFYIYFVCMWSTSQGVVGDSGWYAVRFLKPPPSLSSLKRGGCWLQSTGHICIHIPLFIYLFKPSIHQYNRYGETFKFFL